MNLPAILDSIRPGASWELHGEEYSGLIWKDEIQSQPSEEECEAAWVELEVTLANAAIDKIRQRQYMLRSDPLFFKYQRGEATQQEWLDEIAAIRAEYPQS